VLPHGVHVSRLRRSAEVHARRGDARRADAAAAACGGRMDIAIASAHAGGPR
jgi:hypothetical protein